MVRTQVLVLKTVIVFFKMVFVKTGKQQSIVQVIVIVSEVKIPFVILERPLPIVQQIVEHAVMVCVNIIRKRTWNIVLMIIVVVSHRHLLWVRETSM